MCHPLVCVSPLTPESQDSGIRSVCCYHKHICDMTFESQKMQSEKLHGDGHC
jgi:hypothetical protein